MQASVTASSSWRKAPARPSRSRVSVLGHIQRGGSPTVEDRMKASMLGEKAALAIISGASDIVFGFNEGKVVGVNLFEAVNNTKTLNPELVRLARVLA